MNRRLPSAARRLAIALAVGASLATSPGRAQDNAPPAPAPSASAPPADQPSPPLDAAAQLKQQLAGVQLQYLAFCNELKKQTNGDQFDEPKAKELCSRPPTLYADHDSAQLRVDADELKQYQDKLTAFEKSPAAAAPKQVPASTDDPNLVAKARVQLVRRYTQFCLSLADLSRKDRDRFGNVDAKALCDDPLGAKRYDHDNLSQLTQHGLELTDAVEALASFKEARGHHLVDQLLVSRCLVAICSETRALGVEPLVELPVGKSFSMSQGPLGQYVNNHEFHVDVAAGVRVWGFRDIVSLSVYLSKPLSDRGVRIPGSTFEYPPSALRRSFPGFALGLLYDTIWLSLDRDELRNPDSTSGVAHDPKYPPNAVVGTSWTVTLAILPVTTFRSGIGALSSQSKQGGGQ